MNYKKTYYPKRGYIPICRIGESTLNDLEFGIIELDVGGSLNYYTEGLETAFIILEGRCNLFFDGEVHENLGGRKTVFESHKAEGFYMPCDYRCKFTALEHLKIAVCASPTEEKTAPQVFRSENVELKSVDNKEVSIIIDGNSNATKLTVGECYSKGGCWTVFPPHKHDVDDMPQECKAEEIYYFLFNPREGFAMQCLYSADGKLDESYRVKNNELVELPFGYHATSIAPNCESYTLFLMAGSEQGVNKKEDPKYKQ